MEQTRDISTITNIPVLSASDFQFNNYGADIPFMVYVNGCESITNWIMQNLEVLGFCTIPMVKPTFGCVAVMFRNNVDGWIAWDNVPYEVLHLLNEKLQ
jgi:hypothetical protein